MHKLDRMLNDAHEVACTSSNIDCYSGACPVNNTAFLLNEHKNRKWMLYGLMVYLQWLGQTE